MLPSWVIVQTKTLAEEITERQLRTAGYRVYLPRYRRVLLPHGVRGKPATTMRPLFARLVFVQDWHGWPLLVISGAVGLMQSRGTGKATLSDADVALIMDRERAGDFDMAGPRGDGKAREDLALGDQVEFDAAFGRTVVGVLAELSPNGKAIVWATLFDRSVSFNVDSDMLHKRVI